jgi:hypothetical protein
MRLVRTSDVKPTTSRVILIITSILGEMTSRETPVEKILASKEVIRRLRTFTLSQVTRISPVPSETPTPGDPRYHEIFYVPGHMLDGRDPGWKIAPCVLATQQTIVIFTRMRVPMMLTGGWIDDHTAFSGHLRGVDINTFKLDSPARSRITNPYPYGEALSIPGMFICIMASSPRSCETSVICPDDTVLDDYVEVPVVYPIKI